jgi:hypothetical protein
MMPAPPPPSGAQFDDFYMRDSFADTGLVPVTDASVSESPDVIPYGSKELTAEELVSSWGGGPPYGAPIVNNNTNNIYVRAKNLYSGPTGGQIQLYWAVPNLLVQPSTWRANIVPNSNGFNFAGLDASLAGEVCAGDQPFNFVPTPAMGSHFCFVGTVTTPRHSDPIPATDFSSWEDFVDWVRDNANVVWHNVDIVNSLPAQGYLAQLAFENPTLTDQVYAFSCSYKNLPQGSTLRVYAVANPPSFFGFDTGLVQVSGNGQLPPVAASFPAGYSTVIFTQCAFPGAPPTPPAGAWIQTTSLAWVQAGSATHEKYADIAVAGRDLGADGSVEAIDADGIFVPLASFTAQSGT